MSFGNTYNNNDKKPTNITYSAVGFSNPNGKVAQSKLNISYFNKVLKIGIANKKASNNNEYDTYDNDNQAIVYVSSTKARILSEMINKLVSNDDIFNVSIELKNGLLVVSKGSDLGADSYCIMINSADEAGNISTAIYETKKDYHKGYINYTEDDYKEEILPTIEIDAFRSVLDEYVKASTYAVAATVMEASMYKREASTELLYSIGRTVGALSNGNNSSSGGSYFSRTSNNNSNRNSVPNGVDTKEYEISTFDSIANS